MLGKPFFRRNTLCIARENGAAQRGKTRRPGALAVFSYTRTKNTRNPLVPKQRIPGAPAEPVPPSCIEDT